MLTDLDEVKENCELTHAYIQLHLLTTENSGESTVFVGISLWNIIQKKSLIKIFLY